MATKKNATTALAPVGKSRSMQLIHDPSKTEDRQFADMVADGLVSNALTAARFAPELGDVSLTDLATALREQGDAVNRGDLAAAERMLVAQAVALNTMFSEMARRAALNMGEHLGATESYMRLALKAQSQSRATVETLAAMKNPPVVFARQANITSGPQQVNNGVPSSTHAANMLSEPNRLLETEDGKWMDTGAPSATGRADPQLATVGAVNRTADSRREGAHGKQRIQGRSPAATAGADKSRRRAAR